MHISCRSQRIFLDSRCDVDLEDLVLTKFLREQAYSALENKSSVAILQYVMNHVL